MVFLNIAFLVADEDTACQSLIVDFPALQHLVVDSRTLLKQTWSPRYGVDCSITDPQAAGKNAEHLDRHLVAQMQHTGDELPNASAADWLLIKLYDNQNSAKPVFQSVSVTITRSS